VDDRFPESAAFARAASEWTEKIETISRGDVTQFWYENLHRQWEETPLTISGLTGPEPLFCLDTLARGCGVRTIMAIGNDRFSCPSSLIQPSSAADARSCEQIAEIAELTRSAVVGRSSSSKRLLDWDGPASRQLVTWVIAPAGARSTSL
jgi:hypothetical protein